MKIIIDSEQNADDKWYPSGHEEENGIITPIEYDNLFETKEEADNYLKEQYKKAGLKLKQ